MKKVLILTWSYWGWHNVAASSLWAFYESQWRDAKILDIIDFVNKFLAKSSKEFHKISCEEYPSVWKTFFNVTDFPIIARILYWVKDPIWQPKFNKIIDTYKPNVVISVFPFWNWWVKNYLKDKWQKFIRWIVVTDAINIQSFWYVRPFYVDKYFVIDEFSKKKFIDKFDYPSDKVVTSFFPLKKKIFIDKENIWNKNVLFLLTWINKLFADWFLSVTNANVTVLRWRNNKLYEYLKLIFWQKFIFIDSMNISENLGKFDIFIWKPWWAITSECIATDTFMFVPNFIPWQEEWNLQLLELNECWIYESDPVKAEFLRKHLNFNSFLDSFKKVKIKEPCDIIYKNLL